MNAQRLLKRIHILGTVWFLVCASALLVVSLRQAGVNWWLIFSISGYGVVLFAFLLALYLFALFRGVVRAQYIDEHPLSTSPAYLLFYDAAPFLGAVAGLLGSYGISEPAAVIRIVAEGTLAMTFLTWVLLDSVIGLIEAILPESRRHRARRLAEARAEKRRIQRENVALLESLEQRELNLRREWEQTFRDGVEELIELYCGPGGRLQQIQAKTAEIGAKAWHMGQIACMRFVHQMIRDRMCDQAQKGCVDYAALWWDGIGTWRRPKEPTAALIQTSNAR
ncbi:MAG TPA: hypothetical protein ENN97_09770 [Phycisphaerales bacterium]|nr:hypothetical protein [Phycisphaerales bacterium]